MELQFKTQDFQTDAAEAICKIFEGQPYGGGEAAQYRVDPGADLKLFDETGYRNAPFQLTDDQILANLRSVQIAHNLQPSTKLAVNVPTAGKAGKRRGKAKAATSTFFDANSDAAAIDSDASPKSGKAGLKYNFTVEMETGVGKTYTYIKTMHELYRRFGWRKFIVIVPSVAIREGVYKSFQIMEDHFREMYAEAAGDDRPAARIHPFFIYNSYKLEDIQTFAQSEDISVMIINSQAFNTKEKARGVSLRIYERLDDFGSRRPIDLIAATNPILIIDEPQSVEGEKTREMLGCFTPLMTLRYSATPKEEYDLVYRLDAKDAYDQKLVKKIAVKGISESNVAPNGAYLYLERINLSEDAPTATFEFYAKNAKKPRRKILRKGDDLYAYSDEFEAYKNGYVVESIDGREGVVSFRNGVRIRAGEVVGKTNEEQLRRIQIRETIMSHIEKERKLFRAEPGKREGVKVLSLFFIDEVAKYRVYENGAAQNGIYADIFEEEYRDVVENIQWTTAEYDGAYQAYLASIDVAKTHAGYFSIDKKTGRMIDSKGKRGEDGGSDDVGAYDLIMKDKERLLDLDPRRSPVRFIFSHSALREGWDNPNVFQICTLKQSASETRKRQEVGRGMRLCVDQSGKRLDASVLKDDVHAVNLLTVIASESYENYVAALQSEIAEAVFYRPREVTSALFENQVLRSDKDPTVLKTIDKILAENIVQDLIANGYVEKNERTLTDDYYAAVSAGTFQCASVEKEFVPCVREILNSVFTAPKIDNDKAPSVEVKVNEEQMKRKEFQELWKRINAKTYYLASFDSEEVIKRAITNLNSGLKITPAYVQIRTGVMETIDSKEKLGAGEAFTLTETRAVTVRNPGKGGIKYDLVGKLAEETDLTRREIVKILLGMNGELLEYFQYNPEEFIKKASQCINDAKVTAIVEHIGYKRMGEEYDASLFTAPSLKANPDDKRLKKHVYDHVLCDSKVEKNFAQELEAAANVVVYAKLPGGFYIPTPYGNYNPDWAIAFNENDSDVKHIYFVAETKGCTESCQLRDVEKAKIRCAKKHFDELVKNLDEDRQSVQYEWVSSYDDLLKAVRGIPRPKENLITHEDMASGS